MKLHERYFVVRDAQNALLRAFLKIVEEKDLTAIEAAQIAHEVSGTPLIWALRDERHPDDPSRKSDEE